MARYKTFALRAEAQARADEEFVAYRDAELAARGHTSLDMCAGRPVSPPITTAVASVREVAGTWLLSADDAYLRFRSDYTSREELPLLVRQALDAEKPTALKVPI